MSVFEKNIRTQKEYNATNNSFKLNSYKLSSEMHFSAMLWLL